MAKKKKSEVNRVAEQKKTENANPKKLPRKAYERELERLHAELVKLQYTVKNKGLRVIVVFEGRDAAGKGGAIKRITERVSPRVFRVVALPVPTEREKTQLYTQRYITHFPGAGEVVLFDRSWYNRAGVEPVMGFCTREQHEKSLRNTPVFERLIVDSGVKLVKYWFDVSMEEQERRLRARVDDPRKNWKLSPIDLASFKRWYDYSRARDDMFQATDTDYAPWYVVRANNKRRARLNCISHLLSLFEYEELPREKIVFGKRRARGKYDDNASIEGRRFVPEKY